MQIMKLYTSGKVKISNLRLPQNIGLKIICTNQPENSTEIELEDIIEISREKTISFIFGTNKRTNKGS